MNAVTVVDSSTRAVLHTCSTIEGAESFIAGLQAGARISGNNELLAAIDDGVFDIDASEELVNPHT